jgi:hypothetical protein
MSDVVLTFFCPVTKGKVEWDTPHDAKTLATHWSKIIRLSCCHCKGEHTFSFREAYVEALIDHMVDELRAGEQVNVGASETPRSR